jgi:hypothetical protein
VTLAARRDLLAAVLDALIPAADGFPSAGAAALDHLLAAAGASAELAALLDRGLDAVEAHARAAGGFAGLGADEREDVLRRVEGTHAESFQALVRHTYEGYYTHPAVVTRLGLDPGPLHPRGHRAEAADPPDLARVTARGPRYRRA